MKKHKILLIILLIIAGLFIFSSIYVNDYYHSKNIETYMKSTDNVNVIKENYGYMFDGPGEKYALIFYPGAKVEETAYSPLLYKLAENGIDCFLVKMPFRLAILDSNKANKVINKYNYEDWTIMGHSLGGAMASNYAYNNSNKINKVILLGAYSTKNLNKKGIKTYYIYGSNDLVLSKNKLEKSKNMLDNNYEEYIINGGNHSSFAYYGNQKHDGKLNITVDEQIEFTYLKILDIINN